MTSVRERPTRLHVAEPSYPRSSSRRARLLGPHLRVHVEPGFESMEVGPVSLGEVHVVLLLGRSEELRLTLKLLQLLGAVGGHEGGAS